MAGRDPDPPIQSEEALAGQFSITPEVLAVDRLLLCYKPEADAKKEGVMDWTDCPVIEVVPGKMSGAPVLRHSRVRPQDLLNNLGEGPEWMADAFGLSLDDVRQVLSFYHQHRAELAPVL